MIFLPFLQFDHFGHLLTETAAWLSPLLRRSRPRELPEHVLLGSWAAAAVDPLSDLLSLDRSRLFTTSSLTAITHLPEAWVPVPSMVNRDRIDARHSRAVRRLLRRLHHLPRGIFKRESHRSDCAADPLFLYLSRSALGPNQRHVDGEAALEHLLKCLGWTVIHPEQLVVAEQLHHLARASVVAGPLGSAFHLLLPFGALPQGPLVLTLGLAQELTSPGPSQNFAMQFERQQLPFEHLPVLCSSQPGAAPGALPRDANLQFAISPQQVAQQLQHLAQAFVSTLPQ